MELKKLLRTILSVVMVAALVFGCVAMLAGCRSTDNNKDSNDKNNAAQYEGLEKEEYLQKLGENNLGAVIDSVGEVYGEILGGLSDKSVMDQTGGAKVNMTLTVGDPSWICWSRPFLPARHLWISLSCKRSIWIWMWA